MFSGIADNKDSLPQLIQNRFALLAPFRDPCCGAIDNSFRMRNSLCVQLCKRTDDLESSEMRACILRVHLLHMGIEKITHGRVRH